MWENTQSSARGDSLRETPIPRWERVLAWVLIVHTALDMTFITDRPRGRDGLIPLEGGRYYLRNSEDVWVDVWEFERLAHRAEQLAKAGRLSEAAESWEQALALHGELGLLPDEIYLPPESSNRSVNGCGNVG